MATITKDGGEVKRLEKFEVRCKVCGSLNCEVNFSWSNGDPARLFIGASCNDCEGEEEMYDTGYL